MAKNIFETLVGALVLVVALGFIVLAYQGGTVSKPKGITLTARFDRVDGLMEGADVRMSGLVVGSVLEQKLDPQNYLAIVTFSVDSTVTVPDDSTAEILGDGLLGAKYLAIVPGGSETALKNGEEVTITQSAVSIESLIGKFMFDGEKKEGNKQKEEQPEAALQPQENNAVAPTQKSEEEIFN